jgi:peroxiredoxin
MLRHDPIFPFVEERFMTPDVNEVAPEFEVVDSTGAAQTLSGLVAAARRVLIFYRGHW